MKTQDFLNTLKENESKGLLFEYQENKFVDTNYHITEVKNTVINSVDCGGKMDEWNETVIQLWESPSEKGKIGYLKSDKALSILERVHGMYPLDGNAIVKFEYSNDNFHKSQLEVQQIEVTSSKIIVQLFVSQTDCKAKDTCGVPETALVSEQQNSCAPGSGCC
jgi:hypothetical protein